jgi:sarcosine oxidase subunit gamma
MVDVRRQWEVRVEPSAQPALSAALGLALPGPNHVSADGDRGVLWLAPDGWLVIGGPDEQTLRSALAGHACSVVDVSAQRSTVVLAGPAAPAILAHGCALDLERVMTVGRCAQTTVARAPVLLWRPAEREFRLLVRISFASYLRAWLADASTEYGAPEHDGTEYGHAPMDPTPIGEHDVPDRTSGWTIAGE